MSKYPNSGIVSENTDRREGKNDPNEKGYADITCPHCQKESSYWVSGWTKDGNRGPFLSLSFKVKDAAPAGGSRGAPPPAGQRPSAPRPGPAPRQAAPPPPPPETEEFPAEDDVPF